MLATALTCVRCGMDWIPKGTSRPQTCPECPPLRLGRGRGDALYDMALELVTLRLAFEQLEPLLNMGRHREADQVHRETRRALQLLRAVEAPARRLPHPREAL